MRSDLGAIVRRPAPTKTYEAFDRPGARDDPRQRRIGLGAPIERRLGFSWLVYGATARQRGNTRRFSFIHMHFNFQPTKLGRTYEINVKSLAPSVAWKSNISKSKLRVAGDNSAQLRLIAAEIAPRFDCRSELLQLDFRHPKCLPVVRRDAPVISPGEV